MLVLACVDCVDAGDFPSTGMLTHVISATCSEVSVYTTLSPHWDISSTSTLTLSVSALVILYTGISLHLSSLNSVSSLCKNFPPLVHSLSVLTVCHCDFTVYF